MCIQRGKVHIGSLVWSALYKVYLKLGSILLPDNSIVRIVCALHKKELSLPKYVSETSAMIWARDVLLYA